MKVLTPGFQNKVEVAVGINFTVTTMTKDTLFFENLKFKGHSFYLHCEFLSEDEVFQVVEILKEVFAGFPMLPRITSMEHNLNNHTSASAKFVTAVLAIHGSALHKLLLLCSGTHLLWKLSSDRVIDLARAKHEACSTPASMGQSATLFRNLKHFYILPGISPKTVIYGHLPAVQPLSPSALEYMARLMAFVANNSKISFTEYLKLDFAKSVATQNILDFTEVENIHHLVLSDHKVLAESMIASHLISLTSFVTKSVDRGKFPEIILRNRAAALAAASFYPEEVGLTSVLSFLSDEERASLESLDFVDHLDALVRNSEISAYTPPIIFATLAEVLAARGLNKAFEVAREMKHLKLVKEFHLRLYEATIALMAEALDPANDEFPFSWSAQLSEHAWVFTSHQPEERELSLKV